MIAVGLALMNGLVFEAWRARTRTEVTRAIILDSYPTMMGIGPLRLDSIEVKYEFFVSDARYESRQLVDALPDGSVVSVRYDPKKPKNNSLIVASSARGFMAVFAGLLIVIGTTIAWHTWRPIAFWRLPAR